jgi:hypothetical protein
MKEEDFIKTHILSELLGCGIMDIEFLVKKIKEFKVDVEEAVSFMVNDIDNSFEFNNLIYRVFETAVINCVHQLNIKDFDYNCMDIYCNYMDSHLSLIDDGEYIEVHDYNECLATLKSIYLTKK